jgi:hypothetical protein
MVVLDGTMMMTTPARLVMMMVVVMMMMMMMMMMIAPGSGFDTMRTTAASLSSYLPEARTEDDVLHHKILPQFRDVL